MSQLRGKPARIRTRKHAVKTMVGISIVFSCDTLAPAKIGASYRELQNKDDYKISQFFSKEKAIIGFSGYEGYPLQCYEDKNVLILLEGLIYDKTDSEINIKLRKIAEAYHQREAYKGQIIELTENSDGDYIVFMYFKNEQATMVFNDRWGRLPAFFFAEDNTFAFSREIKFLLHWITSIEFDPIAMAEFLIYEYNLGQKTLIKGITRFNPASFLEVQCSQGKMCVTEEALLPVNFETIDLHLSRNEIIKQCVKLYKESLSVRVKKTKERGLQIIADLSGGYDTRAVFGGLCQMHVPFTSCTDNLDTGDESYIARQLTDSYDKTLCKFSSSHLVHDFSTLRNITYLTDCTVNGWTAVSCYYDSLEREKSFVTPTAQFMGFGGEFIRHPYRLKKHYPSLISMLEDAAYTNSLPPLEALAITKLNRRDFRENLEHEVAQFTEHEERDKVKHLYFEYYNKLVNGGENRHRMFSWTVQPLWGKNLFTFEMKHIPSKMISYMFFIDFLGSLDRRLLTVPIYGSNLRLDSRVRCVLYEAKMRMREMLSDNRYAFNLWKWMIRGPHKNECQAAEEVRRMFQDTFVSLQFDCAAIEKSLKSAREIEIYHLLTLVTYIAEVGRRFGRKVKCC
jgi:asparagine synthase (glutamine-hydrolysing)